MEDLARQTTTVRCTVCGRTCTRAVEERAGRLSRGGAPWTDQERQDHLRLRARQKRGVIWPNGKKASNRHNHQRAAQVWLKQTAHVHACSVQRATRCRHDFHRVRGIESSATLTRSRPQTRQSSSITIVPRSGVTALSAARDAISRPRHLASSTASARSARSTPTLSTAIERPRLT